MTRTFIVAVAAAGLLAACNQNTAANQTASAAQPAASQPATTSAPAQSGDAMQQKVNETAGSGAKDCGRPSSQDRAALDSTASCVMDAAQAKKAFTIVYDMPGMSVAVAGNSEGKVFALQQVQPEGGAKGEINVAPCPAELRVAQSGRVTCFPQGTMGVPPGAANPHAGTASGGSPHGGMGMPPAGTPNPHAGNMTTKPPSSKTPPQ